MKKYTAKTNIIKLSSFKGWEYSITECNGIYQSILPHTIIECNDLKEIKRKVLDEIIHAQTFHKKVKFDEYIDERFNNRN